MYVLSGQSGYLRVAGSIKLQTTPSLIVQLYVVKQSKVVNRKQREEKMERLEDVESSNHRTSSLSATE
jgi:hypothetical protein